VILIDAMRMLRNYGCHDIKLVISGLVEKEYSEYFKKLASDKGVEDQVLITGYIAEDDLVMLYNLADIFLYPQTDEGFGLPPLEAMACGAPVIASNSSAIPEVVGDAAILVNPFSADEIATSIADLRRRLANPFIRNEIIRRGFEKASSYQWSNAAAEYVNLFSQLADQSSIRRLM
jgi:glycosyltransferase involved in cell wall biosynthesis